MQRILVAIDGSEHGERALDFASQLAVKFDAELLIVHVLTGRQPGPHEIALAESEHAQELMALETQQAQNAAPAAVATAGLPALAQEAQHAANVRRILGRRLIAAAEATAKLKGVSRTEAVLLDDDPAAGILAVAERRHPGLIIVGSNGHSHPAALLLGSVSDKVVRLSPCTVAVAR